MTRKCVLCKETNYKNTYSFFSAPKDPDIRKKWQAAIAIDNYAVTDDTYVCSKHFHKNDIITHWVSGVPPHVITIKYKKCRLRPGAVPGRNYHLETDVDTSMKQQSEVYEINMNDFLVFKSEEEPEEKNDFAIPRESIHSNVLANEATNSSGSSGSGGSSSSSNSSSSRSSHSSSRSSSSSSGKENFQRDQRISSGSESSQYEKEKEYRHGCKWSKDKLDIIDFRSSLRHDGKQGISYYEDISQLKREQSEPLISTNRTVESAEIDHSGDAIYSLQKTQCNELQQNRTDKKFDAETEAIDDLPTESFSNVESKKEGIYMEGWERKTKISVSNTLNAMEDILYANNSQFGLNSSSTLGDTCNENENETDDMLFEDLLEVCTEVSLPRGWSCLVASKGHATTIVYVYMGITKSGVPFVEKQVFLKSDMVLRCVAANREINPLIHNLIKEEKRIKVQTLIDIEELIDEFDQRTVCKGICNTEDFQRIHIQRVAYRDGIKWRHISCPLIINNDSSRCSKCITLSRAFATPKSKMLFSFAYCKNVDGSSKERQRIQRCTRERDRRYKFTKLFRKIE